MRITSGDRLEVGIQLPVQALSKTFAADWERAAGPPELVQIAQAADAAGFFYVAVCDHVAIPRRLADHMGTTWFDTVATLGHLAAATTRIRLLSHVYVLAYRHPLQTASAFATLDQLSGGRVVLGVGAGHVEEELDVFGVEFAARGSITDEAIQAVSSALSDEFPEHRGARWQFADLGVGPRPVQRPRPPIWIGGSSRRALRRVGELGDGWLPQGTPLKELPAAIAEIHEHRAAAGRADEPLDIGANGPWVHVGPTEADLGPRVVAGSPERIAEILHRYRDIGVHHVQIGFPAGSCGEYVEQVEAFGRDVLPLLGKERP